MLNTLGIIVDGVSDVNSMISAADATASVASNSQQMPMANQDSGSKAILAMGEKAKTFMAEPADKVADFVTSLLGASSNMFSAAYSNVAKVEDYRDDMELLEEPVEEVDPEPIPAKYAAPDEFYLVDEDDMFPEERYEAALAKQAAQKLEDDENRKKVIYYTS